MQKVFIYVIKRVETGDCYVGSTITPQIRWIRHRSELKLNKHHSAHLQNAWNKYGEDAFSYEVLDVQDCPARSDRLTLELSWIARMGHYNALIPTSDKSHFTSTPLARAIKSTRQKYEFQFNPEFRARLEKRGADLGDFAKSPEGRANMSEHSKRRWKDPEERERLRAGIDRWVKDPDAMAKQAETGRIREANPELKAVHAARTKALWDDPVVGAKYREAGKIRWSNPEAKAHQAQKMREYHAKRRAAKAADVS